jgi:lysozyme family protein
MLANRAATLAYIDADEGPEVNISAGEPGGGSAHGLSVEVWNEYNKAHGLPVSTVKDLGKVTATLAGQVYAWRFLDPIRFDDLPAGVDYRMADAAITLGETGACLILQMALQMYPVTGIMDAATLKAVDAADPKIIIAALDAAWLAWKHGMTADGWSHYSHGWINRVVRVRDRALAMLHS